MQTGICDLPQEYSTHLDWRNILRAYFIAKKVKIRRIESD